jgi:hypothetical protein
MTAFIRRSSLDATSAARLAELAKDKLDDGASFLPTVEGKIQGQLYRHF